MRLDRYDVAIIISVAMFMATRFVTKIYFGLLQDFTQVTDTIIRAFEANPTAAQTFLSTSQLAEVLSYLLIPGIIFGMYLFIKKKTNDEAIWVQFVGIMLLVSILNIVNDLGAVFGLLLR